MWHSLPGCQVQFEPIFFSNGAKWSVRIWQQGNVAVVHVQRFIYLLDIEVVAVAEVDLMRSRAADNISRNVVKK